MSAAEAASAPGHEVRLDLHQVAELARAVLLANGISERQAEPIVRITAWAERDECHSHGLYRILGYARAAQRGLADGRAEPKVHDDGGAIVRVEAARGFAPLAFDLGRPALVAKARQQGVAALAIRNCHHNAAVWAEVEPLAADDGLAAIAFLPSVSVVAPAGGTQPLFGTDPFAFAWPRAGQPPFVFDFATSAAARGEIELRKRRGEAIPPGWGLDRDGQPTTDPAAALSGMLLPFGGHKGTAIQFMIELLAGAMIGDAFSFEALERMPEAGSVPMHGELILAFDPARFGGGHDPLARAEVLFGRFAQIAGARLPSQRRYEARTRTPTDGITLPRSLFDELTQLAGGTPAGTGRGSA